MILADIMTTSTTAVYVRDGSTSTPYATLLAIFLYDGTFNLGCNPLIYSVSPLLLTLQFLLLAMRLTRFQRILSFLYHCAVLGRGGAFQFALEHRCRKDTSLLRFSHRNKLYEPSDTFPVLHDISHED